MTPLLRTVLFYSFVPVIFTIEGAGMGVYLPGMRRLRSHVLHFAAGVVFSVVAVDLLPEIQRRALVWDVAFYGRPRAIWVSRSSDDVSLARDSQFHRPSIDSFDTAAGAGFA